LRFVPAVLLAVLLLAQAACDAPETSELEGGLLDDPIGLAYLDGILYVSNANLDLSGAGKGFVLAIDARRAVADRGGKDAIIGKRSAAPFLADLALDPATRRLFVASRQDDEVLVLDIADATDMTIIDQDPDQGGVQGLPTGSEPYAVAIRPDGRYLYATSAGSGELSVIDLESRDLARSIGLASGVLDVEIQPGSKYAWVSNRGLGTISLIDTELNAFAVSFNAVAEGASLLTDTRGILFTADGAKAYISVQEPPMVIGVDATRLPEHPEDAVVSYIPMRATPYGLALSPDGTECWVANFSQRRLMVIDTRFDQVVGAVEIGRGPTSVVAVHFEEDDPAQYYVFATDYDSHGVAVVDGLAKTLLGLVR
jgi:YVTN family beta-propeller protein